MTSTNHPLTSVPFVSPFHSLPPSHTSFSRGMPYGERTTGGEGLWQHRHGGRAHPARRAGLGGIIYSVGNDLYN